MSTHENDIFTKEGYMTIIRKKRRDFVHNLYNDQLNALFDKLRQDANDGKNCHHEITFQVESHHNIDCIQMYLLQYFQDIGYQPIIEPRKSNDGESKITLTLT